MSQERRARRRAGRGFQREVSGTSHIHSRLTEKNFFRRIEGGAWSRESDDGVEKKHKIATYIFERKTGKHVVLPGRTWWRS